MNVLRASSPPLMLCPSATIGSSTSSKMPTRSSITKTPNTRSVNFCFLMLRSSKALIMMVVEDIEIIEPRKKLSVVDQPSKRPV